MVTLCIDEPCLVVKLFVVNCGLKDYTICLSIIEVYHKGQLKRFHMFAVFGCQLYSFRLCDKFNWLKNAWEQKVVGVILRLYDKLFTFYRQYAMIDYRKKGGSSVNNIASTSRQVGKNAA